MFVVAIRDGVWGRCFWVARNLSRTSECLARLGDFKLALPDSETFFSSCDVFYNNVSGKVKNELGLVMGELVGHVVHPTNGFEDYFLVPSHVWIGKE